LRSRLGAVIPRAVLPRFHTGQPRAQGRTVALPLVRDDHPRDIGSALPKLADESRRRLRGSLALSQDLAARPVLVDGAPPGVALARAGETSRIQVPCVARAGTLAAQRVGRGLPPRSTPIPDRCRGPDAAAFGHERFDVPGAEATAQVAPDTLADNRCREPLTRGWSGCWRCLPAASMPYAGSAGKGRTVL
jgi:hypothetical protein